jgi:MFS family permease
MFYVVGIFLFSLGNTPWVLFFAMFVLTFGEVTTVIGMDPYTSRRIPCTHRGRVDGLSSVVYSVFHSLGQFFISWMLLITENRYSVLWAIIIGCGIASALLYLVAYRADKKTFPLLYTKK